MSSNLTRRHYFTCFFPVPFSLDLQFLQCALVSYRQSKLTAHPWNVWPCLAVAQTFQNFHVKISTSTTSLTHIFLHVWVILLSKPDSHLSTRSSVWLPFGPYLIPPKLSTSMGSSTLCLILKCLFAAFSFIATVSASFNLFGWVFSPKVVVW